MNHQVKYVKLTFTFTDLYCRLVSLYRRNVSIEEEKAMEERAKIKLMSGQRVLINDPTQT